MRKELFILFMLISLGFSAFTFDVSIDRFNEFRALTYYFKITNYTSETFLTCDSNIVFSPSTSIIQKIKVDSFSLNLSNNELEHKATFTIPSSVNNYELNSFDFEVSCNSNASTSYGVTKNILIEPLLLVLYGIFVIAMFYAVEKNKLWIFFAVNLFSGFFYSYYQTFALLSIFSLSFALSIISIMLYLFYERRKV